MYLEIAIQIYRENILYLINIPLSLTNTHIHAQNDREDVINADFFYYLFLFS